MKILVTGGAGYIGSITNRYLQEKGWETVVFDNLSTGYRKAVSETLFIEGDLKNSGEIKRVFQEHQIDAVIHFAALALAGESMQRPYDYYLNNIVGGLNLLEAMRGGGCDKLIFSSTCAVYGYPKSLPVAEDALFLPVSVYGSSKLMFEEIISWYGKIYGIKSVKLRYFNAAGATMDGEMGEFHPEETHIIPIALSVAVGKRSEFELYGDDYQTTDGTCVRDYIHVWDLAEAHEKAVEYLNKGNESIAINLGVGQGYTNLEVLSMVENVIGKKINKIIKSRRVGDPDAIYADNTLAKQALGWEPKYSDLETIVKTAWKWHQKHPNGY